MADGQLDLEALTIAAVLERYSQRSLTAAEVTQAYLDAIASIDKELNAVCHLSASAIPEAKELDRYQEENNGALKGPLHGVPLLIKDQIETNGLNTSFGSILAKDYVPDRDASLVQKLREAGAIILGKAMMPDWAAALFSTSSLSGTTKNPYDLTRESGGSSSGSAAGVAGNLALASIGGDTGGSIRLPSSFCSLIGVRCTPGRISRDGMSALVVPQDTAGPMAKTVEDAARLLDVLVGYDDRDNYTSVNVYAPSTSFLAAVQQKDVTGKHFGVLRQVFGNHGGVNSVMENALQRLQTAGAVLVNVEIPNREYYREMCNVYPSRTRSDINKFLASRQPNKNLPKSFSDFYSKGIYHDALDGIRSVAVGPDDPSLDTSYGARLEVQMEYKRLVTSIFAMEKLDAILYPTCQIPAPKTAEVLAHKWPDHRLPSNTNIASQLHFPAISVPAGFCDEEGRKLPVGMEILGLPLKEDLLIATAAAAEKLLAARRPPVSKIVTV